MRTILGASGVIGITLPSELKTCTSNIRLVSRNPKKVNETDHTPGSINVQTQNDTSV